MKIFKTLLCSALAVLCSVLCFGCGTVTTNVTLGTYQQETVPGEGGTFTPLLNEEKYSLRIDGTNLILEGVIPYSEAITIGEDTLSAGNIVAIRFKPSSAITLDDDTKFQTTNADEPGGFKEHDKDKVETDGSIIWITSVSKNVSVQIKIRWNANFDEVAYILTVDEGATLEDELES